MLIPSDSGPPNERAPDAIVYRFTVERGMVEVIVIETPDWYAGLVQAALARVRIEGLN